MSLSQSSSPPIICIELIGFVRQYDPEFKRPVFVESRNSNIWDMNDISQRKSSVIHKNQTETVVMKPNAKPLRDNEILVQWHSGVDAETVFIASNGDLWARQDLTNWTPLPNKDGPTRFMIAPKSNSKPLKLHHTPDAIANPSQVTSSSQPVTTPPPTAPTEASASSDSSSSSSSIPAAALSQTSVSSSPEDTSTLIVKTHDLPAAATSPSPLTSDPNPAADQSINLNNNILPITINTPSDAPMTLTEINGDNEKEKGGQEPPLLSVVAAFSHKDSDSEEDESRVHHNEGDDTDNNKDMNQGNDDAANNEESNDDDDDNDKIDADVGDQMNSDNTNAAGDDGNDHNQNEEESHNEIGENNQKNEPTTIQQTTDEHQMEVDFPPPAAKEEEEKDKAQPMEATSEIGLSERSKQYNERVNHLLSLVQLQSTTRESHLTDVMNFFRSSVRSMVSPDCTSPSVDIPLQKPLGQEAILKNSMSSPRAALPVGGLVWLMDEKMVAKRKMDISLNADERMKSPPFLPYWTRSLPDDCTEVESLVLSILISLYPSVQHHNRDQEIEVEVGGGINKLCKVSELYKEIEICVDRYYTKNHSNSSVVTSPIIPSSTSIQFVHWNSPSLRQDFNSPDQPIRSVLCNDLERLSGVIIDMDRKSDGSGDTIYLTLSTPEWKTLRILQSHTRPDDIEGIQAILNGTRDETSSLNDRNIRYQPLIPAPHLIHFGVNDPTFGTLPSLWLPMNLLQPASYFATPYAAYRSSEVDHKDMLFHYVVRIGSLVRFYEQGEESSFLGLVLLPFVRSSGSALQRAVEVITDRQTDPRYAEAKLDGEILNKMKTNITSLARVYFAVLVVGSGEEVSHLSQSTVLALLRSMTSENAEPDIRVILGGNVDEVIEVKPDTHNSISEGNTAGPGKENMEGVIHDWSKFTNKITKKGKWGKVKESGLISSDCDLSYYHNVDTILESSQYWEKLVSFLCKYTYHDHHFADNDKFLSEPDVPTKLIEEQVLEGNQQKTEFDTNVCMAYHTLLSKGMLQRNDPFPMYSWQIISPPFPVTTSKMTPPINRPPTLNDQLTTPTSGHESSTSGTNASERGVRAATQLNGLQKPDAMPSDGLAARRTKRNAATQPSKQGADDGKPVEKSPNGDGTVSAAKRDPSPGHSLNTYHPDLSIEHQKILTLLRALSDDRVDYRDSPLRGAYEAIRDGKDDVLHVKPVKGKNSKKVTPGTAVESTHKDRATMLINKLWENIKSLDPALGEFIINSVKGNVSIVLETAQINDVIKRLGQNWRSQVKYKAHSVPSTTSLLWINSSGLRPLSKTEMLEKELKDAKAAAAAVEANAKTQIAAATAAAAQATKQAAAMIASTASKPTAAGTGKNKSTKSTNPTSGAPETQPVNSRAARAAKRLKEKIIEDAKLQKKSAPIANAKRKREEDDAAAAGDDDDEDEGAKSSSIVSGKKGPPTKKANTGPVAIASVTTVDPIAELRNEMRSLVQILTSSSKSTSPPANVTNSTGNNNGLASSGNSVAPPVYNEGEHNSRPSHHNFTNTTSLPSSSVEAIVGPTNGSGPSGGGQPFQIHRPSSTSMSHSPNTGNTGMNNYSGNTTNGNTSNTGMNNYNNTNNGNSGHGMNNYNNSGNSGSGMNNYNDNRFHSPSAVSSSPLMNPPSQMMSSRRDIPTFHDAPGPNAHVTPAIVLPNASPVQSGGGGPGGPGGGGSGGSGGSNSNETELEVDTANYTNNTRLSAPRFRNSNHHTSNQPSHMFSTPNRNDNNYNNYNYNNNNNNHNNNNNNHHMQHYPQHQYQSQQGYHSSSNHQSQGHQMQMSPWQPPNQSLSVASFLVQPREDGCFIMMPHGMNPNPNSLSPMISFPTMEGNPPGKGRNHLERGN